MNPESSANQNSPATPLRPYRRQARNILIHKPMQREFTFVVILLFMISMLAIGSIIHFTIRDAAFGSGFHFGKINPYEILAEVSSQLTLWISCILFATLVVIGFFGIFFLHRVAGPVFRFRQILIKLNHGHIPPPIRLREGDFFMEVAEAMNQHLEMLQKTEQAQKRVLELSDQILSQQPSDSVQGAVREMKSVLTASHQPTSPQP
jgi:hypothetical protein